jgi:pre-mRNA-processing factor 19
MLCSSECARRAAGLRLRRCLDAGGRHRRDAHAPRRRAPLRSPLLTAAARRPPAPAVSGAVPEEPVVAKPSGLLFERRLIEKVLAETGRCPVTDAPLSAEDLLPLATRGAGALRPRPAPAASVPGLLSLLQNEWDAAALEAHALRGALHAARQELSHALYQHDAATRVVARLLRERDAARAALEAGAAAAPAAAATSAGGAPGGDGGDGAPAGKRARPALPAAVAEAMAARSAELSRGRKKRAPPPGLAPPEAVATFALRAARPLHATRKGGVLALALAPGAGDVFASGGADATVQLFDRAAGRALASLTGHAKRVNALSFMDSAAALASASADGTVRLWRAGEDGASYACAATLKEGASGAVAVAAHPAGSGLLLAGAADGSWSLWDGARGERLARAGGGGAPAAAGALHPDGLIWATGGADGAVRLWEVRGQARAAELGGHAGGDGGGVAALAFSENGYHLASAGADGARVWDLRKLRCLAELPNTAGARAVAWDGSGAYLAVGGAASAAVHAAKQEWAALVALADACSPAPRGRGSAGAGAPGAVTALAWAPDARALLAGAGDHNVREFAAP